uniref:Uncharacterized protein n=1 Tax=Noctiluca scintillans TaxID=2966 RepID=A0A7S1AGP3_NOCSC|mmetsp:Transcript_45653/g.121087  ORF Transcript_45653/g.121087 Transcript_45653/m.121087 type:complete len:283 (+) Transcript_45653:170-1018(+)|eukprot:CAMPEP_0194494810 /NCGR_PEP_ID=MMETSP0253-20130528/12599_1 /TAXON_ID=2966 /ORGANISM="Noctiluca scintillans" /LENGTH=282 /DNA_ID=CAMNT_0039335975 /DNA_START=89 /DNA_END=937 /DNA_ORIENTATION=-
MAPWLRTLCRAVLVGAQWLGLVRLASFACGWALAVWYGLERSVSCVCSCALSVALYAVRCLRLDRCALCLFDCSLALCKLCRHPRIFGRKCLLRCSFSSFSGSQGRVLSAVLLLSIAVLVIASVVIVGQEFGQLKTAVEELERHGVAMATQLQSLELQVARLETERSRLTTETTEQTKTISELREAGRQKEANLADLRKSLTLAHWATSQFQQDFNNAALLAENYKGMLRSCDEDRTALRSTLNISHAELGDLEQRCAGPMDCCASVPMCNLCAMRRAPHVV